MYWTFGFDVGYFNPAWKNGTFYAMAVHPGDVSAVPVPGAVWLLGSGLLGLIGIRKKMK
jgi:hypothetical protein